MSIIGKHLPLGLANGIATLNSNGQIPASQLDFTALDFRGTWNATTNVPTLSDGTGSNGDLYIVSVGGTRNLGSGSITFVQGNLLVHDATKWSQVGSVIDLTDYYTKEQVAAIYSTIASLSTVAISGSYNDLTSKPTIPSAQVQTDWNAISGVGQLLNKPSLSTVAISGSYSDLSSKPTIPVVTTGSYSTTGIALQAAYSFPHNLGYNPSYVGVEMGSPGAALPYFMSWDGSNITVTFASVPGILSLVVKWFSIK